MCAYRGGTPTWLRSLTDTSRVPATRRIGGPGVCSA